MKKRKPDSFEAGMAEILLTAKRIGLRTTRERIAFQLGYVFGFTDGIEGKPFGNSRRKPSSTRRAKGQE